MLNIIPLGGLGEIGLNMMVFEYGSTLIVVDAGLMFPEDYMLGVDYVIPNMSFLKDRAKDIDAIILTHAHEDHIGAVPFLLREIGVPIYATPFTLGILRYKLFDHGLGAAVDLLREIRPGSRLNFGELALEFVRVGHSVVDGVGIVIETPLGVIVHTGDFKINYSASESFMTDVRRFAQHGAQGVLALLSDSTNVEREGYTISDAQVGKTLAQIIDHASGRVIVALFASNVARIQQIVDIVRERGSKILFNGKSIEISIQIAKNLGYLKIPPHMEITVDEVNDYPDEQIVIVTTGSQGEPMSALARMAAGSHKQIKIRDRDTVILSSKFIPGNERAINNVINSLYRKGAEVIYEKISDIHVSGHAFQEELKLMITLCKPKYFIPIHGEYRHLIQHARLAEQVGVLRENIFIAENGQVIHFDPAGVRISGRVETGRVLVDGKGIGDVGRSVLKERRTLSEDGLVAVNLAFDEETGYVVYGPELESRGFVFGTVTGHLLEDAKCVILEIIEETDLKEADRVERIRTRIQSALRKYFYFAIGRRPVILPFIVEI